ncbi:MAG TPA: lysophospholipid acyltransferase family protein [bacterium]
MAQITPPKAAERIAMIMGKLACSLNKVGRSYIRANLDHIFAHDNIPVRDLNNYVLKTFQNYTRVLVDFFRLGFISADELIQDVEPVGIENCAAALKYKRGSIMITFHLGNWDYAGSYLAAINYPMSALVEELEPAMLELYTRHRERTGMQTYPLAKSAYAFLDIIRKNRILAILADRDIANNGITVTVFDGKRNIPRNLGSIIVRKKLPVLFGHLTLNPIGKKHRYRGCVDPPLFFTSEDEFHAALVRKMEELIKTYPDQWFVFQPEWIA